MFPLSWTSLPPLTLSYPFGLSQTPSLSHTTNSHWLSILHTVGWDGWMASLTRWTWAWVNSRSWWWTGRPGVLQFTGSQRVGHNWATELKLNWAYMLPSYSLHSSHPLLPSPLTMSTMFTFDEGLTIFTGFSKFHSHLNLKTVLTCYKQGTKSNIGGVYKLNVLFPFLRMYLWGVCSIYFLSRKHILQINF